MNLRTVPVCAALLSLSALQASAHHSFSMFDRSKTITLAGTVEGLDWVNPHAWLRVVIVDDKNQADVWSFEMSGIGQLQRRGWNPETVKMGDKVTVRAHPLRDGSYGGQFVSITLPSGRNM